MPTDSSLDTDAVHSDWFDAEYWRAKNLIAGESKGRYTTWFITPPVKNFGTLWVLRHYYRGGLVSRVSRDKFFYLGVKRSRCFKELSLLQTMIALGLPVPRPVAARISKNTFTYQADLLMEKIEAKDLVGILKERPLTKDEWRAAGQTVALFHQKGIFHADLNAHNILLDQQGKVSLIDFDRCEKRPISSQWQSQNIQRLKRSFLKEQSKNNQFHFAESNWDLFVDSYRNNIVKMSV